MGALWRCKIFHRIPIWWRWYYWGCPIAWSLYGLVVSQYGDVKEEMDNGESVEEFVRRYYGFIQPTFHFTSRNLQRGLLALQNLFFFSPLTSCCQ
ncbi:ABC transporter G family member 47-like isoform X2 [Cannabis sativa]|uniref:ABC transporter G family member 47-like isoform X2 n=1 Tax=Cannabis sativa TaxID=3483 RepID=UPI0029CA23BD|nr:ABC transporter G family member 47-like isoform X2 [Cannabis sativa]